MTEIEKILKYQDEDGKLIKIEHEVASSNERKNLMQAINFRAFGRARTKGGFSQFRVPRP